MRGQLMKFRHAQMNCLRGLLAEYGDVMPKGYTGLRRGIATALQCGGGRPGPQDRPHHVGLTGP